MTIQSMNNVQWKPLRLAANMKQEKLVELLLAKGALIDSADASGATALFQAVANHSIQMATLLLDHGASINALNSLGESILHRASRYDCSIEMFEMLMKRGANIHHKGDLGRTPLHTAAGYAKPAIVKLLLDNGADATSLDDTDDSPVVACSAGQQ
ncbi:ankyrin [Microthyrium microscopicum]|uniref:Ankyrin n=1 Tax=Microthyrium microscopicum TaxID=703497 RepID=A0A6A6UA50_9PEZI|nr:ankyrin [Microthyrium microscopicum]